jgi:hypothetical protein
MLTRYAVMVFALIGLSQTGCHSIHSSAVRDLINREGTKIDAAQTNIHQYHQDTQKRIEYLKESVNGLNDAVKKIQAAEAKHSLLAASHQNLLSKKGVDAWSVSYLIGKTYLAEYQGLEQAVMKQFEEDFCALLEAVNRVEDSWGHLASIHTQIERYAGKSFFASVDPELVGALVEHVPGGADRLGQVLANSRTVNDALQEALTYQFLKTRTLERTRSLTVDLLELLERVK